MEARYPLCQAMCDTGRQLIKNKHYASRDIQQRINSLQDMWKKLKDLAQKRHTRLDDAAESHQVCTFWLRVDRSVLGVF